MKKNVIFIIVLVIGTLAISQCKISTSSASKASLLAKASVQQTVNFNMTVDGPLAVDIGDTFQISVEVHLKATVENATDVSIEMVLNPGLQFVQGEESIRDLGNFTANQTKISNYSVTATNESGYVLVLVYLYQSGVAERVDTPEFKAEYYGSIGISINLPKPVVRGPLELLGVVPRLRLTPDEKGTLTFNITNEGDAEVVNLTFEVDSPDTFEVLSISPDSLDSLAPNESVLVRIEGRSVTDSASINRLFFYVASGNYFTIIKVIKIETYDWFNPWKFDNAVSLIFWPIVIGFLIALAVVMTIYYWKKRKERIKIQKDLEEQYGKALKIPD